MVRCLRTRSAGHVRLLVRRSLVSVYGVIPKGEEGVTLTDG